MSSSSSEALAANKILAANNMTQPVTCVRSTCPPNLAGEVTCLTVALLHKLTLPNFWHPTSVAGELSTCPRCKALHFKIYVVQPPSAS